MSAHMYVPYGMATMHCRGYLSQIMVHNAYIMNTKQITIYGLHPEAQQHPCLKGNTTLIDRINEEIFTADPDRALFPKLERTFNTDNKGKWLVLCHIETYLETINYLATDLPMFYQLSTIYEQLKQMLPRPALTVCGNYHHYQQEAKYWNLHTVPTNPALHKYKRANTAQFIYSKRPYIIHFFQNTFCIIIRRESIIQECYQIYFRRFSTYMCFVRTICTGVYLS